MYFNLDKIRETVSLHHRLNTGNPINDEEWEDYLRTEYTEIKTIKVDDDNFFTYKERESYIWIQDFVSKDGIKASRLFFKFDEFKKKIKCQVAITNINILNIIIRKGFKIKDLKGYNYILER